MKVCKHCFNDIELQAFIDSNSNEKGICDYCKGSETDIIDLSDLLDFFTEFFNLFKYDDNGEPLTYLVNKDWNIFANYEESDYNYQIISHILKAIDSDIPNYGAKVVYQDEITNSINYWDKLKEKLKWDSRFLTNLSELKKHHWNNYFTRNKVNLDDKDSLYRARIHQDNQKFKYKTKDMGSPNKTEVSEGRANPAGIPYLYLSKSEKTTLYETRVSYLDEVSIGEFRIKDRETVSVVDFTKIPSAFSSNTNNIEDFAKSVLLKKRISEELSKPLRRYDSVLEYIPTQFICEYIRHIINADGILFESSLHKGGQNIVLFSQEKVECINVLSVKVQEVKIKAEKIK